MDTGFNYYHGADPSEYDLVLSNSEGGIPPAARAGRAPRRAALLGRRPRAVRAAAGREGARRLLLRLRRQVPARVDARARRRAEPPRCRTSTSRSAAATSRATSGRARAARRLPVQRVLARDLLGADQPQRHAALARDGLRRRRRAGRSSSRHAARRSSRTRTRGSSAGSSPAASCSSSATRTRRRRRTASCSPIPAQAEELGRRARERVLDEHTYAHRARRLLELLDLGVPARSTEPPALPRSRRRSARCARVAIVPALNEEHTVPRVIDELRAFDPGLDIVVVDDGSIDRTAEVAAAKARTCSGSRSTSASAAPCRPASATRASTATTSPCASTATASTTRAARRDPRAGAPRRGRHGRRLALRRAGRRRLPLVARAAHRDPHLRRVVSRIVGQRVTDTTSGFQALNRRGIALFARDYPHDYPEVEATVMVHRHRLRLLRGAGGDARARRRPVVDHRARARSTTWSRCCSRSSSACSAATSSRRRTCNDSAQRLDRRRDRVVRARPRRARADPQPAAARALRAAVAAHRGRAHARSRRGAAA